MNRRRALAQVSLHIVVPALSPAFARSVSCRGPSTTSNPSNRDFFHPVPAFERRGIKVRRSPCSRNWGQAIGQGRRGDEDVVSFTIARPKTVHERKARAVRRYPVMYNDFVADSGPNEKKRIGKSPGRRPAGRVEAMRKIAAAKTAFRSRGRIEVKNACGELLYWQSAGAT